MSNIITTRIKKKTRNNFPLIKSGYYSELFEICDADQKVTVMLVFLLPRQRGEDIIYVR